MTERGTPQSTGSMVCPFIAFADDRDARADEPDRRHRCYAEQEPAPRAIAHQEAYCLSAGFAACPTFIDWARRESAASARSSAPAAPAAPFQSAPKPAPAPAPAQSAPAAPSRGAAAGRSWSSPPSWLRNEEPAADEEYDEEEGSASDDDFDDAPSPVAPTPAPTPTRAASRAPVAPSALGSRSGWASDSSRDAGRRGAPRDSFEGYDDELDDEEEQPRARRGSVTAGRPIRQSSFGRDRERESIAPSWEVPHRRESYPSIRERGVGIPKALVLAGGILVAAILLFIFVPPLLFGGGSSKASPTPTATVAPSVEASVVPSVIPTAAPVTYTVQGGDTFSKIAKKFGVTIADLTAANPQITDVNKLAIGDVVNIPATAAVSPTP